ncbi:MAG: MMPL family transporter [Lapillicoccus sp.]
MPTTKPQDRATSDLVEILRREVIPAQLQGTSAQAYVGGVTATFDDLARVVADRLWVLIAVVIALSLVLLTIFFRSVWLPVVSAAFNLLSIGAAYGVVTLAFQTELGTSLLHVPEQPVISFVPMLMFAILFGLSMDYNVFLLSRVREQWLAGVSPAEAVTRGIGETAGVIGAACAIMTLVFAGFVVEEASEVKMIGWDWRSRSSWTSRSCGSCSRPPCCACWVRGPGGSPDGSNGSRALISSTETPTVHHGHSLGQGCEKGATGRAREVDGG